ncbi:MAG: Terminase small subunit [Alphaproteobacteria bacterium ADurb.Bin438]|nr:MAG: Terminase small subunit [Alphaproteobacteria bacterium ADurb.Bin438]
MNHLTEKQEKFCQMVFKGATLQDAYMEAYPGSKAWTIGTVRKQASKQRKHPKVVKRIEDLRGKVAEEVIKEVGYDRAASFKKLCEMQDEAIKNGQMPSAIRAEELKGKLMGLYVEKSELEMTETKVAVVEFK